MRAAEEADARATVLTAIDIQTGMSMATVVTQKGVTRHAVYEFLQFIYETGRTYGTIQTDQELAILDMARSFTPGLSMRASLACHSQSLGTAERYHQSLHAHARTVRLRVHDTYNTVRLSVRAAG